MIEVRQCDPAEVRDLLATADTPRCNPGGLVSLDALCAEGTCFMMSDQERIVGAYVLQPFGDELWITAAAGSAECDLTKVIDAVAAYQGSEFNALVFATTRPGLMKKTLALGYSCTMRKNLK